ncbi:MAG: prepilin-type N-terminal cleavage/methylation domain-containing protein, partial [Bdellovibrionales bacterium]|nr:prepilin-type N-terminal cleavage/methylation domain-containing protein [Bdellovibrionales bacterium]
MQANGYLPKSQENGFTLLEMLVSLLIFSILMGSAASTMFSSFSYSLDAEIIARTEERARSTLDLLLFDLRMMGCGVAIGQEDFSITDGSLGDAPFPVFTDSTASYIHFRMNETGKDALLTADYTPSSSSLTFSVSSTEDYFEGDVIYLSDKIAG